MRETEVEFEVQRHEQERVYCDTCTEDCTDDYEIIPQEVCPRCADEHEPDPSKRFSSIKEFRAEYDDVSAPGDGGENLPFDAMMCTLLWVALFPLMFRSAFSGDNEAETLAVALSLASMVWLSIAYLLAMAIF